MANMCFAKIFKKISDPHVTLQVIYRQKITPDFPVPAWQEDTYACQVLGRRIAAIKSLAHGDNPSLYQHQIYLTLRVETTGTILDTGTATLADLIIKETAIINAALLKLRGHAQSIENAWQSLSPLQHATENDLIMLLRETLHGESNKHGLFFREVTPERTPTRLAARMLSGTLAWELDGIGIGDDTWEVLSWSQQPARIFAGLMTVLMQIKAPL